MPLLARTQTSSIPTDEAFLPAWGLLSPDAEQAARERLWPHVAESAREARLAALARAFDWKRAAHEPSWQDGK
jgi:hypothetical protein